MIVSGRLGFLPRLESLRGIAAVTVLGYHSIGMFVDTNVTGMAPVVLFFVLSGFVLARSLLNDPDPVVFFRHRLVRLLPAATATVLLLSALYYLFGFHVGFLGNFDPVNIVLNALMIKSDINGVMWSMTVECFATPLILASFFIFVRWGTAPLVAVIVVLFGLSFIGPYVHLLGGFTNLAPLYSFVIGVLFHFRGRELVGRTAQSGWTVVAIAAIVLISFCGLKKQTAPIIMLECASAVMLIALVAFEPSIRLFKVLDSGIVRFFGRISYSFYLLHPIGIAIAIRIANPDWTSPASAAAVTAIAIAATAPLAWLSWRFVEMPFVRIGKRRRLTAENALGELI